MRKLLTLKRYNVWRDLSFLISKFSLVCNSLILLRMRCLVCLSRVSKNFSALLERSSVQGPYILVGHSSGGINMRLYANMYPA